MAKGGLRGGPRRGVAVRGGDLVTMQRQHGGIFSMIGKLFGLGSGDLHKHMSDPMKSQMLMQRGGFPWGLAGLSLLPMLMGKGKAQSIQNQMKTTRESIMQRGGLSIPPTLLSKGLPLLKSIGIPMAMGALASVGDNVVDKIFGEGSKKKPRSSVGRSSKSLKKGRSTTAKRAHSQAKRKFPKKSSGQKSPKHHW